MFLIKNVCFYHKTNKNKSSKLNSVICRVIYRISQSNPCHLQNVNKTFLWAAFSLKTSQQRHIINKSNRTTDSTAQQIFFIAAELLLSSRFFKTCTRTRREKKTSTTNNTINYVFKTLQQYIYPYCRATSTTATVRQKWRPDSPYRLRKIVFSHHIYNMSDASLVIS